MRSHAHNVERTLGDLEPGQAGEVVRLDGESGLRHQLLEMGFTTGVVVEVLRRAPLGDPMDIRLRGYRLSLRRLESQAVIVRDFVQQDLGSSI
jgi:ferrous iron transport protein A